MPFADAGSPGRPRQEYIEIGILRERLDRLVNLLDCRLPNPRLHTVGVPRPARRGHHRRSRVAERAMGCRSVAFRRSAYAGLMRCQRTFATMARSTAEERNVLLPLLAAPQYGPRPRSRGELPGASLRISTARQFDNALSLISVPGTSCLRPMGSNRKLCSVGKRNGECGVRRSVAAGKSLKFVVGFCGFAARRMVDIALLPPIPSDWQPVGRFLQASSARR